MKQRREQNTRRTKRKSQAPAPAKITRPICRGVHERARIFSLLDGARTRPIVWISAPPGAGKTTFAASYVQARNIHCLWYQMDAGDNDIASFFFYLGQAAVTLKPRGKKALPILTSDYLLGLDTFAVNFFRELFAHLRTPATLVLDDFHEIAHNPQMHRVLQIAFAQIPAGINVIVLSREPVVGAFARHRASEHISELGWEDIKLTADECAAIVRKKVAAREGSFHAKVAVELHKRTQGWVAGLVLLAEKFDGSMENSVQPAGTANQNLFDYFAYEVFRDHDKELQVFVLKTAFLSKFSADLAYQLTASSQSQQILSNLAQRNLFTTLHSDGRFEYHALFRSFLIAQAHEHFSTQTIVELKRTSARLLGAIGEIMASAELLVELNDWRELAELVRAHAPTLISQGRTQTLAAWIEAIPIRVRNDDAWVLYWSGVCRFGTYPIEARSEFQRAYELFQQQEDIAAMYQTWGYIVESFVLRATDFTSMGPWLDRYAELQRVSVRPPQNVEAESVFAYVVGLAYCAFNDPQLAIYVAKAERLLEQQSDTDQRLMWGVKLIPYYLWKGIGIRLRSTLSSLAVVAHSPQARPLGRIHWYMWSGMAAGLDGYPEKSLEFVETGLALAQQSGVHTLDVSLYGYGIWGQLTAGNVAQARDLLARMSKEALVGPRAEAMYRQYLALVLMHEGQFDLAVEENRKALELARSSWMYVSVVSYLLSLAFLYVAQGDLTAAQNMLDEARPMAVNIQSKPFISYCLLCEADIHRIRGDREQAVRVLREALPEREALNTVTPPYMARENAARLYAMALDEQICPEYVRDAINKTRLPPPIDGTSEQWPWPIRIRALGQFSASLNGVPITSHARQKPMQLLRVLAANGGREVSVATIANALWPDAEGDMAKRAVETSVHRLRRMIGESAIARTGNRLSLNPQSCWLDVWAIDELFAGRSGPQMTALHVQQLLALYKGPLLAGEEYAWNIQQRARWQSRFLRAVVEFAEQLEREGAWNQAAEVYRKALEAEPVVEQLYRLLMRCYQRLDRLADAIVIYQRCRQVLSTALAVEPSRELTALYSEFLVMRANATNVVSDHRGQL